MPEQSQTTIMYAILLVVLVAVLIIFFILPDRKARKEKERVQRGLKVGDKVYTKAGIHGTVTAVDGDHVLLEVGKNRTQLEVARWAILSEEDGKAKSRRIRTIPLEHDD
ncbi:preprotein translocase subunit YajC [uncultured Pseudoflavonifractor sp.]|uniref:preprotein translocase subunit YajC n=1 Tax=uncultured Pseudoflavonifractor sp. TaxID=1221379 RepID=UPI00260010B3|nr:preprotein translocase subunit YajC [uncultured Pseudoflavonifractor sp.]